MTSFRSSRITKTSTLAAALAAILMLGGCFSNPLDEITDGLSDGSAEEVAEKIVEEALPGDAEIDIGASLPEDFPSSITLIDGTILMGQGMQAGDGKIWSVTIDIEGIDDAMDQQVGLLHEAGFQVPYGDDISNPLEGIMTILQKDDFLVSVTGREGEAQLMVQVTQGVGEPYEDASATESTPPPAGADSADPDSTATAAPDGASGDVVCEDAAFAEPAAAPTVLADSGTPFYPCAREMAAIPGSDPLFVGEYDTPHESIIVEGVFKKQFDGSDWEIVSRTNEGDNAITQAQKPGYALVVVVGPSRMADAVSSIHYTLRSQ